MKRPDDRLFVDEEVYAWKALDEYAIAAYWVGKFNECRHACNRLLENPAVPESERARIEENRNFCKGK